MKPILLLAAGLLWPLGTAAQGFINFNTKTGTSTTSAPGAVWAPVYLRDPVDFFLSKTGNTPTGIPAGTQTYAGGFVIGSNFTAQLWGGPAGSTEDQLVVVATTTFRTQTASTVAGTVVPVNPIPTVPGVQAGQYASFQLRVWYNNGGTVTSWAQVMSGNPLVARGLSPMFTPPFRLSDGSPLNPIPNLQGLQSFTVGCLCIDCCLVPEPSLLALGLLGACFLSLRRSRKT